MEKPGIWPLLLVGECVLFLFFWWVNPYVAWLLTCILVPVFWAVGIVAALAELFEKTTIRRSFFIMIGILGLLPALLAILFLWLDDFSLSWMN